MLVFFMSRNIIFLLSKPSRLEPYWVDI